MLTLLFTVTLTLLASWSWRRREALSRRQVLALVAAALALIALLVISGPRGLVLQKVAGRLLMPAGLLWVSTLAAALWSWHRRHIRLAAGLAALWLATTAAGSELVGETWIGWLQRDFREVNPLEAGPFEAVLVLGGGSTSTATGGVAVSETGDRIVLAARMFHARRTERLVASGESIEGLGPHRQAGRETAELWRSLGVPDEAILVLSGARNTTEEVRQYRRLVRREGWRRVGLITSAWHLRRALRLCAAQGLEVDPLPARTIPPMPYLGLYSLIPSGPGFNFVHNAAWETLGALVGR